MTVFEKFEPIGRIDWSKFTDPMVSTGVKLMKQIEEFGFEAYIVGGAVRDIAMGDFDVHDIDIATNMPIDEIKDKFRTYEYVGGERHGTELSQFIIK
jgi:tRNA nucleotidyltransferase/poly(A) polymerase